MLGSTCKFDDPIKGRITTAKNRQFLAGKLLWVPDAIVQRLARVVFRNQGL